MCLGDDMSNVPGEKERMLRVLALLFSQAFQGGTEPLDPNDEPTLKFSSNDHTVDSYLWGEKGARTLANIHV